MEIERIIFLSSNIKPESTQMLLLRALEYCKVLSTRTIDVVANEIREQRSQRGGFLIISSDILRASLLENFYPEKKTQSMMSLSQVKVSIEQH